jgi:hypothetical protein
MNRESFHMDTTDAEKQLINTVVGHEAVEVGHSLAPCTITAQSIRCHYRNKDGGQLVTFVDTPAFPQDESQPHDGLDKQLRAWMKKA